MKSTIISGARENGSPSLPATHSVETVVKCILPPFWRNPFRQPERVVLLAWETEIRDIQKKVYDIIGAPQNNGKPQNWDTEANLAKGLKVISKGASKALFWGPSIKIPNQDALLDIGAQVYANGRGSLSGVRDATKWQYRRCLRLFNEAPLVLREPNIDKWREYLNKCLSILAEVAHGPAMTAEDEDNIDDAVFYAWVSHYKNAAHFIFDVWKWGVQDFLLAFDPEFDEGEPPEEALPRFNETLENLLQNGPDIPNVPHGYHVFSQAESNTDVYRERMRGLVEPLLAAATTQNKRQKMPERRALLVEGLVKNGFGEEVIPRILLPENGFKPR